MNTDAITSAEATEAVWKYLQVYGAHIVENVESYVASAERAFAPKIHDRDTLTRFAIQSLNLQTMRGNFSESIIQSVNWREIAERILAGIGRGNNAQAS